MSLQGDMGEDGRKGDSGEKVCQDHFQQHRGRVVSVLALENKKVLGTNSRRRKAFLCGVCLHLYLQTCWSGDDDLLNFVVQL